MNTVVEWFASGLPHPGSLGLWILWIALLLVAGVLPSLLPRNATDSGSQGIVRVWAGLLLGGIVLFRGSAILQELGRLGKAVERDAAAQRERLAPLLERLPDGAGPWLAQLPWREIAVASAVLILAVTFYLPRRSRFGHSR